MTNQRISPEAQAAQDAARIQGRIGVQYFKESGVTLAPVTASISPDIEPLDQAQAHEEIFDALTQRELNPEDYDFDQLRNILYRETPGGEWEPLHASPDAAAHAFEQALEQTKIPNGLGPATVSRLNRVTTYAHGTLAGPIGVAGGESITLNEVQAGRSGIETEITGEGNVAINGGTLSHARITAPVTATRPVVGDCDIENVAHFREATFKNSSVDSNDGQGTIDQSVFRRSTFRTGITTRNCEIENSSFYGKDTGSTLKNCDISADSLNSFSGTQIKGSRIAGEFSSLQDCDIKDTLWETKYAEITDCNITGARSGKFFYARFIKMQPGQRFEGDMSSGTTHDGNCEVAGAVGFVSGGTIEGKWDGVEFRESNGGTRFEGSFNEVTFGGSGERTKFSDIRTQGSFRRAEINRVRVSGQLHGDFTGAQFVKADLSGCRIGTGIFSQDHDSKVIYYSEDTVFPKGFNPKRGTIATCGDLSRRSTRCRINEIRFAR